MRWAATIPFVVITNPVPGQDLPEGRTHQSLGLEHLALTTEDVPAEVQRLGELGGRPNGMSADCPLKPTTARPASGPLGGPSA